MSSTLSQAKILGGTGWILVLLSVIPRVGFILGIIGFVLVLLATKQIADAVSDRAIFRNMIISTVLGIAALIVVAIVVLVSLTRITNYLRDLSNHVASHPRLGVIILIVLGLLVVWLLYLVSAFFLRRSFNKVALRLNAGLFRTAGLVFLIGAALTIILVGFLILFIAEIMFAIAFFTMPEQVASGTLPTGSLFPPSGVPPQNTGAPPSASAGGNKFCSKCGASIPQDTIFCPSCGQKQA